MLAVLALFALQHPALRAESLLAVGRPYAAARLMERVVARDPRDPAAYLLLGRAHFARPVVGRYPALAAFRTAARLAPHDPAPLYWQTEVGFFLGSDEGDRIAREALIALFAVDPDYRDTWARFRHLFGSEGIWRRAAEALARHPTHPRALARRGELALLRREPDSAAILLDRARALGDGSIETLLLRTEAAFLAGDLRRASSLIDSAVVRAVEDSGRSLWSRFWPIASPRERAVFESTPPSSLPDFFAAFLDRRDPNLVTAENERLWEHFMRLAEARRRFRLLHPLNQYHHSAFARAAAAVRGRALLQDLVEDAPSFYLGTPTTRTAAAAGVGPDVRSLAASTNGQTTTFFLAGLDARGVLWLRHGPPRQRMAGTLDALRPFVNSEQALDVESWVYETPQGTVSVGLQRGTSGVWGDVPAGDFVFQPVSARQQRWTQQLLRSDATSLPAELDAPFWVVCFLDGARGETDVYVRTVPGTTAVALWPPRGGRRGSARGAGVLGLRVAPGLYDIGLDVLIGERQGRVRGRLDVPDLRGTTLGLSSLVVGTVPAADDRQAALAAMPPDLIFAADAPLAVYAELYRLHADSIGLARYRVRYRLAPLRSFWQGLFDRSAPVVLEFDREVPVAPTVAERLVIGPARVRPGRYRLTLTVTDLMADVKSTSATIDVTLR